MWDRHSRIKLSPGRNIGNMAKRVSVEETSDLDIILSGETAPTSP